MNTTTLKNLYSASRSVLGLTPDDQRLQEFLDDLDMWPLPEFEEDESSIYPDNEKKGFFLELKDCAETNHPLAKGKPSGVPIFISCSIYPEGIEGYSAYVGTMPYGIAWSDSASDVVKKMGRAPANEIIDKPSGKLTTQIWDVDVGPFTVCYSLSGGIRRIYWGII